MLWAMATHRLHHMHDSDIDRQAAARQHKLMAVCSMLRSMHHVYRYSVRVGALRCSLFLMIGKRNMLNPPIITLMLVMNDKSSQ